MNNKDITLSNLTQRQVELLDHMWSLEDIEDIEAWQATLDAEEHAMSDTLLRLVILESAEEFILEDLSAANKVLQQFRL